MLWIENGTVPHYGADLEAPPVASTGDFEVLGAPETVSLEEGRIVLHNPEE